ncbi:hypothetical protein V6N13_107103 [Hibiscus sabdariffa]|uniref:Uncharacterized protein n=2 Tax=Hibiscus sabdariffa TaxID=183260 RepID=A0ABR2F2S3_9ROSI
MLREELTTIRFHAPAREERVRTCGGSCGSRAGILMTRLSRSANQHTVVLLVLAVLTKGPPKVAGEE